MLLIALAEPVDAVPPFSLADTDLDSLVLVASDPLYRTALLLSLKVAGLSTLACLLAGYPMALAIAQSGAHRRALLLLAVMLPFWTGFLMRINAWIGLLQDDGWINAVLGMCGIAPLHLLYTDAAMYVGIVYTYLPFMVLPLYARLSQIDPALLEAAADLGASPWRGFVRITLPLSLPGVWAGALLVFIPAVGEYVIPELLGGPQAQLIGRVLWGEFFQNRDWPTAAAVAVAMLVVLLLVPGGLLTVIRRVSARRLPGPVDVVGKRQPTIRRGNGIVLWRLFRHVFPLPPTLFGMFAYVWLHFSDFGQVRHQRAVLFCGYRIHIAHSEAYIFRHIVADIVHPSGEHRVARFERHEHLRERRYHLRCVVAVQRTALVHHMHECPGERENRKMRALKPQLLRAAEAFAFRSRHRQQYVQLRHCIQ